VIVAEEYRHTTPGDAALMKPPAAFTPLIAAFRLSTSAIAA
jgi:hypothetical protein